VSDWLERLRELDQQADPAPWERNADSLHILDPADARLTSVARNLLPLLLDVAEAAGNYRDRLDHYPELPLGGSELDQALAAFQAAAEKELNA
jgi:hypothetical protein